mmetsp:Transcript_87632/g.246140  ORF Transcript_87632/g.246140 Transcript_87632/m.246140 type:complete len:260 (-) Transcript_87632:123-902(-)
MRPRRRKRRSSSRRKRKGRRRAPPATSRTACARRAWMSRTRPTRTTRPSEASPTIAPRTSSRRLPPPSSPGRSASLAARRWLPMTRARTSASASGLTPPRVPPGCRAGGRPLSRRQRAPGRASRRGGIRVSRRCRQAPRPLRLRRSTRRRWCVTFGTRRRGSTKVTLAAQPASMRHLAPRARMWRRHSRGAASGCAPRTQALQRSHLFHRRASELWYVIRSSTSRTWTRLHRSRGRSEHGRCRRTGTVFATGTGGSRFF